MNILKSFFGTELNKVKTAEYACPNCWGKQSYEGNYVEVVNDKTKSSLNNEKGGRKTFIQQFVERNITGILLKKNDNELSCIKCNSVHKLI